MTRPSGTRTQYEQFGVLLVNFIGRMMAKWQVEADEVIIRIWKAESKIGLYMKAVTNSCLCRQLGSAEIHFLLLGIWWSQSVGVGYVRSAKCMLLIRIRNICGFRRANVMLEHLERSETSKQNGARQNMTLGPQHHTAASQKWIHRHFNPRFSRTCLHSTSTSNEGWMSLWKSSKKKFADHWTTIHSVVADVTGLLPVWVRVYYRRREAFLSLNDRTTWQMRYRK